MIPAFIMDRDHQARGARLACTHGLVAIECESTGAGGREPSPANMKYGGADLEAIGDFMHSVEPDRIPGDIQRAVLLAVPFADKTSSLAHNDMTPQRTMASRNSRHFNL